MPQYLTPGVYVEEVDSGSRPIEGVATAVAAFVGLAQRGPFNEPTLVTNWTQFVTTFGEFVENSYLAHAVYGFFMNGGGVAYIVRIGGDGDAPPARGELTTGSGASKAPGYEILALEPGDAGNAVSVDFEPATGEGAAEDAFKITVKRGGKVEETHDNLSTKKGKQHAVQVVNAQSKLIKLAEPAGGVEKVTKATVNLSGGGATAPARLEPADFIGDSASRTGLGALEAFEEVTMVALPDAMAAYEQGMIDLEQLKAVQLGLITHCELMNNRLAIIDPPRGYNAQMIRDWRLEGAGYDSKQATLYWPWIKVSDPLSGKNIFVPPSGHVAGVWANTDNTRGVHKAPANEVIRGAVDVELKITAGEQGLLNPEGINCIRAFPGRGIRIWGARTLSSDPAWKYVNVRRFFNYVESSIKGATDWAVFEPNDQALWAKLRRTIASFLVMEWRKGALFGLTPDEAFFVKCDSENNPAEGIDLGQVVVDIGIAPVKPAEFVIFRVAQLQGGSSLVND
jgi:phage tail sheath protein FI